MQTLLKVRNEGKPESLKGYRAITCTFVKETLDLKLRKCQAGCTSTVERSRRKERQRECDNVALYLLPLKITFSTSSKKKKIWRSLCQNASSMLHSNVSTCLLYYTRTLAGLFSHIAVDVLSLLCKETRVCVFKFPDQTSECLTGSVSTSYRLFLNPFLLGLLSSAKDLEVLWEIFCHALLLEFQITGYWKCTLSTVLLQ